MRYVGLDVHWRQSSICVLDTRGRKLSAQAIQGGWSTVLEELEKNPRVEPVRPPYPTYERCCGLNGN